MVSNLQDNTYLPMRMRRCDYTTALLIDEIERGVAAHIFCCVTKTPAKISFVSRQTFLAR